MEHNILQFPVSTDAGTAKNRGLSGLPTSVMGPFRLPGGERSEAATTRSTRPGFTLAPSQVWSAICDGRVLVHYQPQYEIGSGDVVAAEALVRLIDTDGQVVYPDRFIEQAEQSDLIAVLGRAVIEQVCADIAACRGMGIVLQRVAINLSAHQLNVDTGLPGFVDQAVARHGLQHSDLEFELTERRGLTADDEGTAVLRQLCERGSRIVIDDFGMGYSSVAYLTLADLPISAFKLDRSLVSRLPEDKTTQCVVRSLLMLAADLGLEVVAEGIETTAQEDYLAQAGCVYAQGFAYARPMAIADLQDFLAEQGAPKLNVRVRRQSPAC